MTITMPQNLVDDGAVLVHPAKAFLLRHIPVPEIFDEEMWEKAMPSSEDWYISAADFDAIQRGEKDVHPEQYDYILRLRSAAETLFGPMEFDLHSQRRYDSGGLKFHADHEDFISGLDEDRELVRMATCVHNATGADRHLYFQRPDWSNHTEEFRLPIPAGRILIFGGNLITGYTHGIPASEEVSSYRSVVTRFSLWKDIAEEDDA